MSITKATPRPILKGINDLSRRKLVVEAEQLPQHLPHLYLLTERGPTLPQVAIGDSFAQLYGSKSLDLRSKFTTHLTVLAKTIMANGNTCMIQRLKPAGAATALLRFSLEVIPAEIPVWQRDSEGNYDIDSNGDRIQELNGVDPVTTFGYRLVWHKTLVPYTGNAKLFGQGTRIATYRDGSETAGSLDFSTLLTNYSGGAPVPSTLYPILDLEVSSFGDYGNRVGVNLMAPTSDDLSPGDFALMNDVEAFIYRLTCVERPETSATGQIWQRKNGDNSIDVVLKDGVTNPKTNEMMSITDTFIDAYQELNDPTIVPLYGPFGRLHLYRDQLDAVLTRIIEGGEVVTPVGSNSTTQPAIITVGEKLRDTDAGVFGRPAFTGHPTRKHLLNIFTGSDQYGVPYWQFDVSNSIGFGGIAFNGSTTYHYASGGDDGLFVDANGKPSLSMNTSIYDELVANEISIYGKGEAHLLDDAKYPHSTFWDSGFSLATKEKMLTPIGRRKDLNLFLSTQAVGDYTGDAIDSTLGTAVSNTTDSVVVDGVTLVNKTFITVLPNTIHSTASVYLPAGRYKLSVSNTPSVSWSATPWVDQAANSSTQEVNNAMYLSSMAKNYPESEIYGTPVCRVAVVGRTGVLLNSDYRGILPLTIDVADKVSRYMGAGIGRWSSGQAFDDSPNNQVTMFRDINITWQPDNVYNDSWDNGLIWVQNFDRRQQFYPAFQTVYPDDTSVLNSIITMMACCELEKVAQRVWRQLTGNSKLTKDQFIERSNALITSMTVDRFDGRFVIQPETYFTEADDARGYSWSCNIHIYANNMKTVGTFTVVAHRMEDLAA